MRAFLIVFAVLVSTSFADAHQSSLKYVDVTIEGSHATFAMTVAPSDVVEPLGLPDTARPAAIDAATPAAAEFVARWIDVAGCTRGPASANAGGNFVIATWIVTCPKAIDELELDFTRFFALDIRHDANVSVHGPGETADPTVVQASGPKIRVRTGGGSITGWISYGMHHIYSGRDHICFVLALLVVVVLQRKDGWQVRAPLSALRATAVVITAFTIAHSVSLIAAALGWISLPSRLVESLIAASIIYTAIENVFRPDAQWRYWLTFGFGLVHGLGFASQLEERLPPSNVIVPLLAFNAGVEVGQLTIVAVALPLVWVTARLTGAVRYRRHVVVGAAIVLTLVGLKWLIERVFAVATFDFLGM